MCFIDFNLCDFFIEEPNLNIRTPFCFDIALLIVFQISSVLLLLVVLFNIHTLEKNYLSFQLKSNSIRSQAKNPHKVISYHCMNLLFKYSTH